jgi:hypothetical protein
VKVLRGAGTPNPHISHNAPHCEDIFDVASKVAHSVGMNCGKGYSYMAGLILVKSLSKRLQREFYNHSCPYDFDYFSYAL